MSKLIEELKQEHKIIIETFKKVRQLGISSKEGQEAIFAVKRLLLAHLKREDEEFYLIIRKAAQSDKKVQQLVTFFMKDMDVISQAAIQFFDKYSESGSGLEFAGDFGKLYAKLNIRIRNEEEELYSEYERLTN